MSSGYRKVSVGRHWSRPKPRIYDCNYRDHERMYKDSYKDYSDTKQYIQENAISWAEKEQAVRQELDNIQRYGTRRAGSLTPRTFVTSSNDALTLRRSNSSIAAQDANAEGSYVRSRLGINKEKNISSDSSSRTSSAATEERNTTLTSRASSLPKSQTAFDQSQDEEMANIERRLLKLRKLREELGLPKEIGSDSGPEPVSARGREIKASQLSVSSNDTSRTSRAAESSSTEDYSSSKRSALGSSSSSYSSSNRLTDRRSSLSKEDTDEYKPTRRSARATAAAAASASSLTSSSKMSNGRSSLSRDDLDSKYSIEPSPRTTRRRGVEDYESSSKSKSTVKSSISKSSGGSSSKIISGDVDAYDDDMLLPDLRKKLPTSQEILDRIKDMEL